MAFSGLLAEVDAQGLPWKQLSPGAHSSPLGQGKLFSQSFACSAQDTPQKLVLIVGDLDGFDVVGAPKSKGASAGAVSTIDDPVGDIDIVGVAVGGGLHVKYW